MQFAKDSFYFALRDRLAALNPARTVVVDGIARTAMVVWDNQARTTAVPQPAAFYLRFGGVRKVQAFAKAERPLLAMECTIAYQTAGVTETGMDRDRLLSALDAELLQICVPPNTEKCDYTQTPTAALGTVLWQAPQLEEAEGEGGYLRRRAQLSLYFFPEVDC